jgi:hypothetical protein
MLGFSNSTASLPMSTESQLREKLRIFHDVAVGRSISRACSRDRTPDTDADMPLPREVEIVDPAHPLYRRRFRTVSVIRESCTDPMVRVEWRFGLTPLWPLRAVEIGAFEELRTMRTRLSVEALEDLVAVAEQARAHACRASGRLAHAAGCTSPGDRRRSGGGAREGE